MKDLGLKLRNDFPILNQTLNHDKPLVYLDNAATTQKPNSVIKAISDYYELYNSNVHRGTHQLSERATEAYESSRDAVAKHLNAASSQEIIFVRGVTEGINLLAQSLSEAYLNAGDEVIISALEHHSNIVPWQWACERKGASLKIIPINERGELKMDVFESLLSDKTKIVSVNHISNALGTINPVAQIIRLAHNVGAKVVIDGAQALPHTKVDVKTLNCDFYVFSGHKMYGPTGIGAIYGKSDLLEKMPPYQGGGEMIDEVSFEKTTYAPLPYKFEAGTPNIEGAVGLHAALDYINSVGYDNIKAYEHFLLSYTETLLNDIPGVRIIGQSAMKAGVASFIVDGIHPHDIGSFLDMSGVAVRVGHHCCMPLMQILELPATVRISLACYNTVDDIDACIKALQQALSVFKSI